MKKKVLVVDAVMSLILLLLTVIIYYIVLDHSDTTVYGMQKVALNEILQLSKQSAASDPATISAIEHKISDLSLSLHTIETSSQSNSLILYYGAGMILLLQVILLYLYFAILAPFERMKQYTEEIARGNFDLTLPYDRANYFGAFTWAFDHMRLEINRARACEQEAIENNKTTIATLSHDLKTPIASIRAYAEGLEANLNTNAQKREYYLQVIMKKCDEVTRLTNDLFYHSLADLDKLTVTLSPIHLSSFLTNAVHDFIAGKEDLHMNNSEPDIMILGDEQRLSQILGNLITNARKYAKTRIDLNIETTQEEVILSVRDYGNGIPDEDLPFVCERFYRGKNCSNESGAGLGLYIVRYLMAQMKGCVKLTNQYPGLKIDLVFPKMIS